MTDMNKLSQRFWRKFVGRRYIAPAPTAPLPYTRLPASHSEAAARLVDKRVLTTSGYLKRARSVPPNGSDQRIVDFAQAFTSELAKRGMPFFVHAYLRTQWEQDAMFERGVSKARWGQSPHNFGMAVDIVHFGRYWDLTKREWDVIGLIGKEVARKRAVKVSWGGDWKFYDPAHWELTEWRDIVEQNLYFPHPQPGWPLLRQSKAIRVKKK